MGTVTNQDITIFHQEDEVVQVFDLVEQQDGYESYTFVEYNSANGKKRAYMPTGMIYKSPDDVRYCKGETMQGTVYNGWTVTQGFNDKTTKTYKGHLGYDLDSSDDARIVAILDGTIVFSGNGGGNGNCIIVAHNLKGVEFYSAYGHLSKIFDQYNGMDITKGKTITVNQNTEMGIIGTTGNSAGIHLHLGVYTGSHFSKGDFTGYSFGGSPKLPFEQSGSATTPNVPYAYNGYYFDGERAKGRVFYDPISVIYSQGGVIARHKPQA